MTAPARISQADMAVLLTEPEAAQRLKLCVKTLRKERRAGRLPYLLIGRAVRYTMGDLDTFIARSRQDASPCQSISRKTHPIGTTTSSGKVIGITARLAANRSGTR